MSNTYLTEEEKDALCGGIIDGVDMRDVALATALIDGYLGRSFLPKDYKDRVKLSRSMRGKLKHAPILKVKQITAQYKTPFGRSNSVLAADHDKCLELIEFDPENDGYFTFIGSLGLTSMIYQTIPDLLEVAYTSGFEELPERLKTACAMLACNIRQAQSFAGAKQLTSLDYQVMMTDDSFFTSDIKMLLKGLNYDVPVF